MKIRLRFFRLSYTCIVDGQIVDMLYVLERNIDI